VAEGVKIIVRGGDGVAFLVAPETLAYLANIRNVKTEDHKPVSTFATGNCVFVQINKVAWRRVTITGREEALE